VSTVLFLPTPAHGHVNPTLAVAAQLVQRGHRVIYLLPPSFQEAVAATGAELVEVEADIDVSPPAGGPPPIALMLGRLLGFADKAAAPLAALYEDLKPDLIVGESMSLWAGLLAQGRGTPAVNLSASYVMGPNSPFRERMTAMAQAAGPQVDLPALGRIAASYGVELGPDPMALFWREVPLTIAFMPAAFHPGSEQFDDRVRFVGPALGRTETHDVALPDGPLLYISLGTVFNERASFFADAITAFGDGPLPVVINHGSRLSTADFPGTPANVTLAPHVPQLQVLERASVFITHGGMGSTQEGIAAGVPLVVVPQMIEQEMTADRVAELGIGVRLNPADVTPARLAEAVEKVTTDPSFRVAAEKMGAAARAAGGAPAAADVIEDFLA
jgi:MGT family glycosyltransferase